MPAPPKGDRALGPYREPKEGFPARWEVILLSPVEGPKRYKRQKKTFPFETPAAEVVALDDAKGFIRDVAEEISLAAGTTIAEALDRYPEHLRTGLETPMKPRSIVTEMFRLRSLFPARVHTLAVADVDQLFAIALLDELRVRPTKNTKKPPTGDTMAGTIAVARKFFSWCVTQKWTTTNPLDGYAPKGLTFNPGGKGKKQLTLDELALWYDKAYTLAEAGDDGAIAGLITLELGVRATQIVTRTARDVDAGGAILRLLSEGKTRRSEQLKPVKSERLRCLLFGLKQRIGAGWLFPSTGHVRPGRRRFTDAQRALILAEYTATNPKRGGAHDSHAASRAVLDKYGIDPAMIVRWRRRPLPPPTAENVESISAPATDGPGHRDRGWVEDQIKRICRLAGVTEATHAHGMRGASASLDHIAGDTLEQVRENLAHEPGSKVTRGSYVTDEAESLSRQSKLGQILSIRKR